MDQDSQITRDGLFRELQEQFGKVCYSQQTQIIQARILANCEKIFAYTRILLVAATSAAAFSTLIVDEEICKIVTTIISMITLFIEAFLKGRHYSESIEAHKRASDDLWYVREKYLALLTDFPSLETTQICDTRNKITKELYKIYSNAPSTSSCAYRKAQKQLKERENQYFSDNELDQLLPKHLRITR